MKCALELVAIATTRAEEIAREEELRKQREKEAKRAATLKMCERLGAELELQANKGQVPSVSFHCSMEGRELIGTCSEYADKRLSHRPKGDVIDLDILTEWFAQFCFEVSVSEFDYYRYCWGLCEGHTVNIKPNPECLK